MTVCVCGVVLFLSKHAVRREMVIYMYKYY